LIFRNFIGIQENALSFDVCDDIIKWWQGYGVEYSRQEKDSSRNILAMNPTGFPAFKGMKDAVNYALNKSWGEYTKHYKYCTREWNNTFYRTWKIQESKPNEGFFGWHKEQGGDQPGRFLVWMIYLNDTIGGETEFFYQNESFTPKKGTCLIWPAAWTHTHRQANTLKSPKFILTGWWTFNI